MKNKSCDFNSIDKIVDEINSLSYSLDNNDKIIKYRKHLMSNLYCLTKGNICYSVLYCIDRNMNYNFSITEKNEYII